MEKKTILWADLCEKTIKKQMNITNPLTNTTWISRELNKKMSILTNNQGVILCPKHIIKKLGKYGE